MSRRVIPLRRRPWDAALVAFFVVNLFFTTYVVSLEQVVIDDIARFTQPIWPPGRLLALVHWWERSFDPLLIARPAWYRATIWLDVLVFGPFYAFAIFANAPCAPPYPRESTTTLPSCRAEPRPAAMACSM